NYIWISYFYSYLNQQGRAGFVMSSQASSAGRDEAKVRQKLIETGDVDIMIAIRSNFFYTRTVPCELWFFDRDKKNLPSPPAGQRARVRGRNTILMLDARNVYRKVTRKIYDFSPEQEQNLLAVVWLYRGETDRYLELVAGYCRRMLEEGAACIELMTEDGQTIQPLPAFIASLDVLINALRPFLETLSEAAAHTEIQQELDEALPTFKADVEAFRNEVEKAQAVWKKQKTSNGELKKAVDRLSEFAETSRDLVKQTDLLYKLATRLIDELTSSPLPEGEGSGVRVNIRDITRARKAADEARQIAVEQLKQVRYFWRQAHWLTERFPEAKLRDVDGLVKLVDRAEIEANDWSLTPGRYVGVAPEEEDEDFDFEAALRDIHVELEDLNTEAMQLAATIKRNFEELGV
ncbi:MAG: N-6 DNA methylase, partial [Gammaproteobacteria bacterium]|nr:N-6 DNA methylase [Gammaproteobacteria bacterium]